MLKGVDSVSLIVYKGGQIFALKTDPAGRSMSAAGILDKGGGQKAEGGEDGEFWKIASLLTNTTVCPVGQTFLFAKPSG